MRRLLVVSLTVIGLVTALTAAAQATDVALFFNSAYVDTTSPSPNAEGQNFKQALVLDGFTVTTFTGITAADIGAAVTGKQVLAFPELEVRDLSPDLNGDALFAIANFVSNQGGTLIVCNQGDGDPLAIINEAFVGAGFVMTAVPVTGPITITSAADGTSFAGGPATLPVNNDTNAVLASSLPASAKIIYADANGNGVVVLIPPSGGVTGGGNIIILGWDWFDAASAAGGTQDDTGWDAVLKTAASITGSASIPTLSEWALIVMAALLVLFGVRGLRRRAVA